MSKRNTRDAAKLCRVLVRVAEGKHLTYRDLIILRRNDLNDLEDARAYGTKVLSNSRPDLH